MYVTPSVTETSGTGQQLTEGQRGCRLQGENNNLQIFREYSREACRLECQVEQAAQRCGCYPWDYPFKYDQDDLLVCDFLGNVCFDNVMSNSSMDNCDVGRCPMDCNSISYSYSIVSTPFKENELCPTSGKDTIFEEFYNNPFPPKFISRSSTFFFNESSKAADLCKERFIQRPKERECG